MQAGEERYKNKGAYVVLEPPNFDNPKFYSFEAVAPRPQVFNNTQFLIGKNYNYFQVLQKFFDSMRIIIAASSIISGVAFACVFHIC